MIIKRVHTFNEENRSANLVIVDGFASKLYIPLVELVVFFIPILLCFPGKISWEHSLEEKNETFPVCRNPRCVLRQLELPAAPRFRFFHFIRLSKPEI